MKETDVQCGKAQTNRTHQEARTTGYCDIVPLAYNNVFCELSHSISLSFQLLKYNYQVYTLHKLSYEEHLESKERFAIKKYLLIIGKKKNMQVLSHTFTYFSTQSPWALRHLSYRDTSLLIPSSYQTDAWLFNQSTTACCRSSSSACRLPARCSFIFKKR